jgi:putative tricarboxylic transport membrane protein
MVINMKSILNLIRVNKNVFYFMISILFMIPFFSYANEGESNIKIVIPTKEGGGQDYHGRLLGEFLNDEKIVGNVNIENIPGAGGGTGVEEFLKIDPKENALLIASTAILVADTDGSLSKDKNILSKLIPIAVFTEDYAIIAVNYSSSYKNLGGLLKDIKKDPMKFKIFGGSKDRGLDHLNFLVAAKMFKINPKNIQYVSSSGGGEGFQKFLNYSNSILSTSFSENIKNIDDKKIKVLAVCANSKLETLPDVPTFKELGIPDCLINYRIIYANKNSSSNKLKFYKDIFDKIYSNKNWNEFSKDNHIVNIDMKHKDMNVFIAEKRVHIKNLITFIEKE